jgi:hypothetical protein
MNSTRAGGNFSPVNGCSPDARPRASSLVSDGFPPPFVTGDHQSVAAFEDAGHEPLEPGVVAVEEVPEVRREVGGDGLVSFDGGEEFFQRVAGAEVVGDVLADLGLTDPDGSAAAGD